jgi:hypothetical protein
MPGQLGGSAKKLRDPAGRQAAKPTRRQTRREMQGTVTGEARQIGRGLLGGDGL